RALAHSAVHPREYDSDAASHRGDAGACFAVGKPGKAGFSSSRPFTNEGNVRTRRPTKESLMKTTFFLLSFALLAAGAPAAAQHPGPAHGHGHGRDGHGSGHGTGHGTG